MKIQEGMTLEDFISYRDDNVYKPIFWAELFIEEFRDESNSSKSGGSIPRDTGRTQDNSIKLLDANEYNATILIGGGAPPADGKAFHPDKNDPPLSWYAGELEEDAVTTFGNPNRHKGFIEKFIGNEFMAALSAHGIQVVSIKIK